MRKVYRSSTDAPRLFRDYFGDFYQTITGAIAEEMEEGHRQYVERLRDEIAELRDEVERLKERIIMQGCEP